MKKISYLFAIAAVALVSAFALSSCEKDDEKEEEGGNRKESVFEYRIFVSDEVLSVGELEVGVTFAGQTDVKKVSALGTVTKEENGGTMFNGKALLISDIKVGTKITTSFVPDEKAVADLPADGTTSWAIKVVAKDVVNPLTLKNYSIGSDGNPVPNENFVTGINKRIAELGYDFK